MVTWIFLARGLSACWGRIYCSILSNVVETVFSVAYQVKNCSRICRMTCTFHSDNFCRRFFCNCCWKMIKKCPNSEVKCCLNLVISSKWYIVEIFEVEIQVRKGTADVSKTISPDKMLDYRFLFDITVNNYHPPRGLKGGAFVPSTTTTTTALLSLVWLHLLWAGQHHSVCVSASLVALCHLPHKSRSTSVWFCQLMFTVPAFLFVHRLTIPGRLAAGGLAHSQTTIGCLAVMLAEQRLLMLLMHFWYCPCNITWLPSLSAYTRFIVYDKVNSIHLAVIIYIKAGIYHHAIKSLTCQIR